MLIQDGPEALRRFVALPTDTLIVLGARRCPPIASPLPNSDTQVGLFTSVGFSSISADYYATAAQKLQPDIVVGLADIAFGPEPVGRKRKFKMSDRTESWLEALVGTSRTSQAGSDRACSIFAPILPIDRDLQSWYLEHLVDAMLAHVSGVAIYDAFLLDDLPEALHHLPRLSLHPPASPHELLRHIGLGVDMCTVPFLTDATDAGIALDFTFPAPPQHHFTIDRHSLGVDLWSDAHAVAVTPLSCGCVCYACTKHHRAYLQHLLAAKEMLGWVLIQLHNHAMLSAFFAGIRSSIEAGTFASDVAAFEAYYEPALPEKTGQGPRMRGYQFKSEAHANREKKNPKAFRVFSEDEIARLRAAHGQQSHKMPVMSDGVDDEALFGLVDMPPLHSDGSPVLGVDLLNLNNNRASSVDGGE